MFTRIEQPDVQPQNVIPPAMTVTGAEAKQERKTRILYEWKDNI